VKRHPIYYLLLTNHYSHERNLKRRQVCKAACERLSRSDFPDATHAPVTIMSPVQSLSPRFLCQPEQRIQGMAHHAASGHDAALPRNTMKLRRLMQNCPSDKAYQRAALCVTAKMARQ
jgi:hypothetical protein